MNRFKPIQTTLSTLNINLLPEEIIVLIQDGVGLYDGKERDLKYDNGTLHLTSHRLIYIDKLSPQLTSLSLNLSLIIQTEFWIGFMKSSAKITCLLKPIDTTTTTTTNLNNNNLNSNGNGNSNGIGNGGNESNDWICRVCGMNNNNTGGKCTLCGVIRDLKSTTITTRIEPVRERNNRIESNEILVQGSEVTTTDGKLICSVCTFINHKSMTKCELCDSPLTIPNNSISRSSTPASSIITSTSNSPSRPQTPKDANTFIKLSFRKGGEKVFYSTLKTTLETAAWENVRSKKIVNDGIGRGGIQSIMRGIGEETKGRESELDDALKDLTSLMTKAKETINLAQTINERISSQEARLDPNSTTTSTAETNLVKNSLKTLGLSTTITTTTDSISSDLKLHEILAKELLTLVLEIKGGVMKDGIVGLDRVWCVWNRVRGVSLISPKILLQVAPHLSKFTSSFSLRTFPSGLIVLQKIPQFSKLSFKNRLLELIDLKFALTNSTYIQEGRGGEGEFAGEGVGNNFSGDLIGITNIEIAREEGIGLSLIKEMVEEIEKDGQIVRDEQGSSLRWHRNFFR